MAGTEGREQGRVRAAFNWNTSLLILGGALVSVPIGFVLVSLPVYLERLPIFQTTVIGLVLTTTGVTAVALMVPVGLMADRFGRRRVLILGGVSASLSLFLLAFASSIVAVFVFAVLFGAAEAFYFASWNALLADASSNETRTTVFGISFTASAVGMAAGTLIGAFADQAVLGGATPQAAYQPLFLLQGALLVVVPLLIPLLRLPSRGRSKDRAFLPPESRRIIAKFFAANILIGFGAGIIVPLFSLWFIRQFGVGESFTGPLFAVSSMVAAAAFLVAPSIARRAGLIRSVIGLQAGATLVLLLIPAAAALGAFALLVVSVLYVVRNALMNMTWPVLSSFLMGAVDENSRSAASAVTGVSFRLPFALSVTLGAFLLDLNLAFPFYVTGVLYALGTVAFWAFFRGYRLPEEEAATA
ncbi:MAG: MFS transporter [Thermoplasmata archaeon]|nr:MFS transporter [Thermoplasmata archaeon]